MEIEHGFHDARTPDALRVEVRTWLDANWDEERPLFEWRGLLADAGWGCPAWPAEW